MDKKPETNRDAIVHAAIEAFIENGFHQTGIRDIARRAGVSLGNLYNHFPGKDALIVEIARLEAVELKTVLDGLTGLEGALESACSLAMAIFDLEAQPENAALTADLTAEAIRNPAVGAVFSDNEDLLFRAMAGLISAGRADRTMGPPAPDDDCARVILDAARAAGMRVAFQNRENKRAAGRALEAMVKRFLATG